MLTKISAYKNLIYNFIFEAFSKVIMTDFYVNYVSMFLCTTDLGKS